jgi:hypothetical protein
LPLLPDDNATPKKVERSARLPDGRDRSVKRTAKYTAYLEQQNLERVLKAMHCTAEEWELKRNHYLAAPQDDDELRKATWKAEKERLLGPSVDVAIERQKTLKPTLWLVAFLLASSQDSNVKSIAALMGYKDERRVQQLIAELYAITDQHREWHRALVLWSASRTFPPIITFSKKH